jgi:hypothetical protein
MNIRPTRAEILAERIGKDPIKYAKLLISLQADIEAMRFPAGDNNFYDLSNGKAFGPFDEQYQDANGEVVISWANLDILLEQLTRIVKLKD